MYLPSSHGVKYCEGSLERLRVFNYDPRRPLVRVVAGLAGLTAIGWGMSGLRMDLHYTNWFGESVFAPFAIVLGLVALIGAIFKPEILRRSASQSRK